jgi:hypothetical protein
MLFVVGGLYIVTRFNSLPNKRDAFEHHYATVGARIAESAYWTVRHICLALAGDQPGRRAKSAVYAGLVLLTTLAAPLGAVGAGAAPGFDKHGIAAAVGALLWGCLLESATLPDRTQELTGRRLPAIDLYLFIIGLVVLDVLLMVVALTNDFSDARLDVGIRFASLVAMADVISVLWGFVLSPWSRYPLGEP